MVRILGFISGVALLACSAGQQPAPEPADLPTGVTVADTATGNALFHGTGGCSNCHGDAGVGGDEGPELRGGRWKLGDGSYDWLVHITRHGGYGIRDRGGEPMPMRGPTVLDSVQVRQVAAYVWTISRERQPPRAPEGETGAASD